MCCAERETSRRKEHSFQGPLVETGLAGSRSSPKVHAGLGVQSWKTEVEEQGCPVRTVGVPRAWSCRVPMGYRTQGQQKEIGA